MKQIISLSLDAEVIENIKNLAEDSERSVSQYVNLVLKEHIQKKKTDDKK